MDFVTQHALKNVWAEEVQDRDHYIRPARLTPDGGSLKYASVGMMSVKLPNANVLDSRIFYHVYHIGQIPPHVLGLDILDNTWIGINEIADKTECYVNVFLDSGYLPPRSKVFLQRLWPGKNVILAVEYDPLWDYGIKLDIDSAAYVPVTLNNSQMNIRFYTNARYAASDAIAGGINPNNQFYFETRPYDLALRDKLASNAEIIPKAGWFLCNGQVYDRKGLVNAYSKLSGKIVDIQHDESLLDINYFRVRDLPTFISIKNRNMKKYLIDLDTPKDKMVYHNDVEYFIGVKDVTGFRGVCIPIMRLDPITMVTNKTHAFRTDIITDIINKNSWLAESDNVHLMAVIRQGGMLNGLIHQNTRIDELFKMSNSIIQSAMTGVNAIMPEWSAKNLEIDDYATIMGAERTQIKESMVVNAYGYNALTYYHHPNPLKVTKYVVDEQGKEWYQVQLSNAATERNALLTSNKQVIEILEYNKAGLLIGARRSFYINGGMFSATNEPTNPVYMVEHHINSVYVKEFSLGEDYRTEIIDDDLAVFGFAAYITSSPASDTRPRWIDVSLQGTYFYLDYHINPDGSKVRKLVWNTRALDAQGVRPMVRLNNRTCFVTIPVKNTLKPKRTVAVIKIPNNALNKVPVEPGTIDIWHEGRLLIETLDYAVDWPNIYVTRRLLNKDGDFQVRLSGVADPETGKHFMPRETGFLKDGVLSVNGHYDIRDDRNIQINIGGAVKHKADLSFSETVGVPYELDGRPYQIRDHITQVELYTDRKTLDEKVKSRNIDKRVMQYLNEYLEGTKPVAPVIHNTRWLVTSVFIDEVLGKLQSGWLSNGELDGIWSSADIERWVSDIKYLLNYDVGYFEDFDATYIKLVPHSLDTPVELDEKQYMLLSDICDLYLKGRIQFNHMVVIKV